MAAAAPRALDGARLFDERRRADGTGLPVGERQSPAALSPCAQKCRMCSQPIVLNAPVVRMRAVSIPGPQLIVPLP
jgi:hypothetical protein